jgi:hypothetical protein
MILAAVEGRGQEGGLVLWVLVLVMLWLMGWMGGLVCGGGAW